jgi:predicted nucleotidyltransferase component of viral defense system
MQDEIFSIIDSDKFYLTGGTCLSRFYNQHRYSDDLDFFFLGNVFPKQDFQHSRENLVKELLIYAKTIS